MLDVKGERSKKVKNICKRCVLMYKYKMNLYLFNICLLDVKGERSKKVKNICKRCVLMYKYKMNLYLFNICLLNVYYSYS